MGLQKLLFASDLSERAARAGERAAQLARDSGATLQAMHVVDVGEEALDQRDAQDQEARTSLRDAAREALQQSTPDCTADTRVVEGDTIGELVRAADRGDIDLLLVGAHGRRFWGDWLLGTTAEQLVRQSRTPTLVVRAASTQPYRKILVATDFSACAEQALRLAVAWFPQARFELVHVLDTTAIDQMREAGVDPRWLERRYEQMRAHAEDALSKQAAACGLDPERTQQTIQAGYPVESLLQVTAAEKPDLVVVGNHGRGRWGDMLLGSVANRLLHQLGTDLLLVRHEG